jgi:hypothetical protein
MNASFNDLIWVKKNSLSEEFCRTVIEKFEADPDKEDGKTSFGNYDDVDKSIKVSTDLGISGKDGWKEEDETFFQSLTVELENYIDFCLNNYHMRPLMNSSGIKDTGYQIQRTRPGEFYIWHNDFCLDKGYGARIITYIWYLNDVLEDGYTEFVDGTRIQPETGKLILFPASWDFVHRGYPPKSETKYICTGWVYSGE